MRAAWRCCSGTWVLLMRPSEVIAMRDKLAHYAEVTGDKNLQPTALIEKLAAEGGSFASMRA